MCYVPFQVSPWLSSLKSDVLFIFRESRFSERIFMSIRYLMPTACFRRQVALQSNFLKVLIQKITTTSIVKLKHECILPLYKSSLISTDSFRFSKVLYSVLVNDPIAQKSDCFKASLVCVLLLLVLFTGCPRRVSPH